MGRGAEKPKLRFLHWMGFYRFANAYPNCIKSQEKFLAFIVLLMLLKITKNERLGHNQSKIIFTGLYYIDGVHLSWGYRTIARRQFTFYHEVPIKSCNSFHQLRKTELILLSPSCVEPGNSGLNQLECLWVCSVFKIPIQSYCQTLYLQYLHKWIIIDHVDIIRVDIHARKDETNCNSVNRWS